MDSPITNLTIKGFKSIRSLENLALRNLNILIGANGSGKSIDDNPTGAPSKRICALAPYYQKVVQGSIAAGRIGLSMMRERCPHFAQWLDSLEKHGEGPRYE